MRQLLDELIELSRIGRLANPSEAVPVAELVDEAAELAIEQGVGVTVGAELPVAYGDPIRLREVFHNLLENALRFMGEQPAPRVEIGARKEDRHVLCWVADNGIGIEPRYHDKIFGLFERLDARVEGTGIGLALVRRIVEHHGGRIWVESEGRGQGSTFYFTLPAAPPSVADDADPARATG